MTIGSVVAPGISALKHNWRPLVLIQLVGFGVAVSYYASPAMQHSLVAVSDFKVRGGPVFAGLSSAFAGVVIPEVAKRLTSKRVESKTLGDLAFQTLVFIALGLWVDFLYSSLAVLFGNGIDVVTIAKKVLVDQVIASPGVSIPLTVLAFIMKDANFRLGPTWERVRDGTFLRKYGAMVVLCWGFWIPSVIAVYAMPRDLQFALFLFAQAAWSLLMLHVSGQ